MKVSVIIPTLNEARRITALVSFMVQQAGNHLLEILVVDAAGSTDDIRAALGGIDPVRVIKCQATSRAMQMNEGARQAKGALLYFVHADVYPPENYTDHILEALSSNIDFGYFRYDFDSNRPLLRLNGYFTRFDGLFTGGGDQTFFISKALFQEMGQFREDLVMMEDFDLFWRLRRKGYHYEILPPKAIVSARKYKYNSYLRVNAVNLVTFTLFRCGFCQHRLKRFYKKALRM
ncbi:MAG: TIGR04283 family arsenosugar biosynthesis glycosyltransferase [Phaeodactylibacter sp.]|nr:TIGR04283 family arsenosugar biosynthesis glycosyltransferase [Phaeodactylibacter sp.]